jgi:hypothetical protein
MPPEQARISRLPIALPLADRLPALCMDLRRLLEIHARGVSAAHARNDLPERDRAYLMSAELLLMQHTCHWYCKSKLVASARLVAAHKTPHAQVLASVSETTRRDYLAQLKA